MLFSWTLLISATFLIILGSDFAKFFFSKALIFILTLLTVFFTGGGLIFLALIGRFV